MTHLNYSFLGKITGLSLLIFIISFVIFRYSIKSNDTGFYKDILTANSNCNSWDLWYGVSDYNKYYFFLFYSEENLHIRLIKLEDKEKELLNYSSRITLNRYLSFFKDSTITLLKLPSLKVKLIRKENCYAYQEEQFQKKFKVFKGFDSIAPVSIYIESDTLKLTFHGKAIRQMMQISNDLDINKYKNWFVFSSDDYDFLLWEYNGEQFGYEYNRSNGDFKQIGNFVLVLNEKSPEISYDVKANFDNITFGIYGTVKNKVSTISPAVILSILQVKYAYVLKDNRYNRLDNCMTIVENYGRK